MINRYDKLMHRIRGGERILIDGATGTEVERRGVPQLENAWNGGGALTHPDIVREIHEDYIRCGAEVVISNTFANSQHAMDDAGVGDQFTFANRRSVELAIEARAHLQKPDVLVAGGISYWSWTGKHAPLDVLYETVKQQAQTMQSAGADLLMLEMMIDIDKMLTTLEAAQTSGLPVWVGLTCEPKPDGTICLRNGDRLDGALIDLKQRNVDLINIMHTEVEYIDDCLDVTDKHWNGPVGVYAHSGLFVNDKCIFDSTISVDDYATLAGGWLQRGVNIIGGCCGIRVEHIVALADLLKPVKSLSDDR